MFAFAKSVTLHKTKELKPSLETVGYITFLAEQ